VRATILVVDAHVEREQLELLAEWRAARDAPAVADALAEVRAVAETTTNLTPATITLARAGGTVGEWADTLRDVFGEYRGPTGIGGVHPPSGPAMVHARTRVQARVHAIGHPIRILVAKPGLDGHSNGAEQIAVAARDAGMEVIYQGIRLTPEQIAAAARDEDVDLVGLSILSGSHQLLVPEVLRLLHTYGVDTPVRRRRHHPRNRPRRTPRSRRGGASTPPKTSASATSSPNSPNSSPITRDAHRRRRRARATTGASRSARVLAIVAVVIGVAAVVADEAVLGLAAAVVGVPPRGSARSWTSAAPEPRTRCGKHAPRPD